MKTYSCRLLLVLTIALLPACSFVRSYFHSDYADYKDFIYERVVEARLFTDGEQRLAIKVLAATAELKDQQEKVSPGFSFDYKPNKTQVIAAVSPQSRVPFIADELKFLLGGASPLSVKEYSGNFLIETMYPFAYPYYRVFLVEFPKSEAQTSVFQVLSSRGRVIVSLKYGSVHDSATEGASL